MKYEELYCDVCNNEERRGFSSASALDGNDAYGWEERWTNAYARGDEYQAVMDWGWAVVTRSRLVPEQTFPAREGRAGPLTLSAYETTDTMHICAACLADPEIDWRSRFGGRTNPWTPQDSWSEKSIAAGDAKRREVEDGAEAQHAS